MIDKYGNEQTIGSKEFEEYLHHRMDKEFCNDIACGHMNKELALQYAYEFFGYALDLQEEVKRLREMLYIAENNIPRRIYWDCYVNALIEAGFEEGEEE